MVLVLSLPLSLSLWVGCVNGFSGRRAPRARAGPVTVKEKQKMGGGRGVSSVFCVYFVCDGVVC